MITKKDISAFMAALEKETGAILAEKIAAYKKRGGCFGCGIKSPLCEHQ